jgi:toxin ParE1/3/4
MKRRTVAFSLESKRDFLRLYDWIADAAGESVAEGYIARIEAWCTNLDLASERGRRRDDLRKGLRIAGFERRVTIAFTVDTHQVTILRVFYGGQDWEEELST